MKEIAQKLLDNAGVRINGNNSWDIQVADERFYERVLSGGSLALGESYMDGWWDCGAIDQFIERILKARLDKKIKLSWCLIWDVFKTKLINQQRKSKARAIGERHYDLGNDLFQNMLDKRMVYSCAYWKDAKNLDEAQERKLDLICRKLKLESGMSILDIGCGWGSLAKFAAEKYGVKTVGITVSKEQKVLADKLCEGLNIEIKLQDYRDIKEKFDRIVSVGMFEHVGPKNYRKYMRVVNECLKNNGLFLLHTIGGESSKSLIDPWINKYIFPNAVLPSVEQIVRASEKKFVLEDWHNFGQDYDKTLMAWRKRFRDSWEIIKNRGNYSERFFRMWNYYLLSCAGSFRSHKIQLWQIVFSKVGSATHYESIR